MQDESILGLLVRALREASAQQHGERYVHDNTNAAAHYESCGNAIAGAISSLFLAERTVGYFDGKKAASK